MTPERLRQVETLFHKVLQCEPSARPRFLEEACRGDTELRREVETLLSGAENETFLDSWAAGGAARILEQQSALASGDRLGCYVIQGPLSGGGMGMVYRARDTRLNRTVAIKVLRPLGRSPEMAARFQREAHIIAQLQHPNICTLHDIGEEQGREYLVMEFLEGETLATVLQRGSLPVKIAIRYAVEIAAALEQAHRRGIVHRDLKPANIMVLKTGVKLLDFGVAAWSSQAQASVEPDSPTLSITLTNPGRAVGTVPYMAPEQLRGEPVDARTDIFAFGLVLYEMLLGRRAFPETEFSAVREAILGAPLAPISDARPEVSLALDRVIALCVEKDPDERWQNAGDLRRELAWVTAAPPPVRTQKITAAHVIAACAVLLAGTSIAIWAGYRLHKPPVARPVRVYLQAPDGYKYLPGNGVALSPAGDRIAFTARSSQSKDLLWLRTIQEYLAQPLQGTEGAKMPFWSPDGHNIAFFADGKLKKVSAAGGPADTICDATDGVGGSWGSDGTILFVPHPFAPVHRVPAGGGESKAVTVLDTAHDSGHQWPAFLPDGRHFLYSTRSIYGETVHIASLDSTADKQIGVHAPRALFRDGRIYFAGGALRSQPFDLSRLEFTGPAQSIGTLDSEAAFDVARNGTIAYRYANSGAERTVGWVDRAGTLVADAFPPGPYEGLALSSDGHSTALVTTETNGSTEIWLDDTRRPTRRSFVRNGLFPVWSPDGKRIVFASGTHEIAIQNVDGNGSAQPIAHGDTVAPTGWSPDGRYIAYTEHVQVENRYVLWFLKDGKNDAPFQFAPSRSLHAQASFSADGRWIVYWSNETGRPQVFAAHFPDGSGKKQVSRDGGYYPLWRNDGRELYFIDLAGHLSAIKVSPTASGMLDFDEPQILFDQGANLKGMTYASTDGKRFLVIRRIPHTEKPPIVVDFHEPAETPAK